jgi:zinc protease
VESLANRYGEELSGRPDDDRISKDWDEALSAVTEEDVMAAAAKVLDRKNAVTGWLTRPATEGEAQ